MDKIHQFSLPLWIEPSLKVVGLDQKGNLESWKWHFLAFILSRLDSDLAKRNSFAHFSAFRPVAKIGDFLQLNSTSAQDSGEICEVSTTVDKDEENEISSKYLTWLLVH